LKLHFYFSFFVCPNGRIRKPTGDAATENQKLDNPRRLIFHVIFFLPVRGVNRRAAPVSLRMIFCFLSRD
jgi:hypothetical protein